MSASIPTPPPCSSCEHHYRHTAAACAVFRRQAAVAALTKMRADARDQLAEPVIRQLGSAWGELTADERSVLVAESWLAAAAPAA